MRCTSVSKAAATSASGGSNASAAQACFHPCSIDIRRAPDMKQPAADCAQGYQLAGKNPTRCRAPPSPKPQIQRTNVVRPLTSAGRSRRSPGPEDPTCTMESLVRVHACLQPIVMPHALHDKQTQASDPREERANADQLTHSHLQSTFLSLSALPCFACVGRGATVHARYSLNRSRNLVRAAHQPALRSGTLVGQRPGRTAACQLRARRRQSARMGAARRGGRSPAGDRPGPTWTACWRPW